MDLIERVTIRGSELTVRPSRRLRSLLPFDFKVSYEPAIDLAELPPQITLLPFLWNVAPIVWATGQEFEVDVLDPRVAASFDAVRDEFRAMYPSLKWDGSIRPRDVSEAPPPSPSGVTAASLFSGGLDSTWTALTPRGQGPAADHHLGRRRAPFGPHDVGADRGAQRRLRRPATPAASLPRRATSSRSTIPG